MTADIIARLVSLSEAKRNEATEAYIAFDRSDPFTAARIATHTKNGIHSYRDNAENAFYSAEVVMEQKSAIVEGREVTWTVPSYRNIRRP